MAIERRTFVIGVMIVSAVLVFSMPATPAKVTRRSRVATIWHSAPAEAQPSPGGLPVFGSACAPWVHRSYGDGSESPALVAADYLVLTCDDGQSELAVLLSRAGRTVTMTIDVTGALHCINQDDEIWFDFGDSTRLICTHDGVLSFGPAARLRFGSASSRGWSYLGQREDLRTFAEVELHAVRVWGSGLSVRAQLGSDERHQLKQTARCMGTAMLEPGAPPVWDYADNEYVIAVDRMPAVASKAAPEYPESALAAGFEGVIIVRVIVGPDGTVSYAETLVERDPELRDAALAAATHWRFNPGLIDGIPVPTQMMVPVRFQLPKTGAVGEPSN